MDNRKGSIEEVSKMKWEKPQLVILSRNTEMTADGLLVYAGVIFVAEVGGSPCLVDDDT